MCKKCWDLCQKLFPEADEQLQEHILWGHTSFPGGSRKEIARHLIELSQLRVKHGLPKALKISEYENWEKPWQEFKKEEARKLVEVEE